MVIWLYFELSNTSSVIWNTLYWILLGLNVVFNLVSCWALGVSFKRMITLKEESKNLVVNYKMMTAHMVSYAIFILSLALYVTSLSGLLNRKTASGLTDFIAICSVISQGLLMLIFCTITKQAKVSKIKSQLLLAEDKNLELNSDESDEESIENYRIYCNQGGHKLLIVTSTDQMIL